MRMAFSASALLSAALLAACGESADIQSDIPEVEEALVAKDVVSVLGAGTWVIPPPEGATPNPDWEVRGAWVDAKVANVRYHKRVFIELDVPYENGTHLRTLAPAWYKGSVSGNAERWGSDALQIYPNSGPKGARMKGAAMVRVRFQHDLDGNGRDEMILSDWKKIHGEDPGVAPMVDPWAPQTPPPYQPQTDVQVTTNVYFSPFDDPGAVVMREMDAIIQAQRQEPTSRHTILAAIFNIYDGDIVQKLVEAHQAGVAVRLVMEGHKFAPAQTWQTGDDELLTAGVPLLGYMRPGNGSMHDKFVILDDQKVATGSFNWEPGSRFENHENMVLTNDPALVRAYRERFHVIAGEVQVPRTVAKDVNAPRAVFFGPDEPLYRTVGRLMDGASKSLYIAMFTAKDVEYEENGQRTSLLRKVVAAHQRGVDVRFMTDKGIAEASEYYGRISADDPTDEWLESQGVHVVLADPQFGRYASMHHKFLTIDDEVVVTGAFNWFYDAAFLNDEDIVIFRDRALAARFVGEMADLCRRYDPGFDPAAWPPVDVRFNVENNGTVWGESVMLVGDVTELGAWDPIRAISLSGTGWPTWTASVQLPAGTRLRYKFVTRKRNGATSWESGGDRSFTVPTDKSIVEANHRYHR